MCDDSHRLVDQFGRASPAAYLDVYTHEPDGDVVLDVLRRSTADVRVIEL